MEKILKAQHISRDFTIGDGSIVNALTDVNIEVEEGKLVCLRGRSGSGKTTLINILGALDRQIGKLLVGFFSCCIQFLDGMSRGERSAVGGKPGKLAFQIYDDTVLVQRIVVVRPCDRAAAASNHGAALLAELAKRFVLQLTEALLPERLNGV